MKAQRELAHERSEVSLRKEYIWRRGVGRHAFTALLHIVCAPLLLPSQSTAQNETTEVLTNEAVVQMVVGKLPKGLILSVDFTSRRRPRMSLIVMSGTPD